MKTSRAILASLLILPLQGLQAEVLLLDAVQQEPANAPGGLPRPTRGMTMAAVEARFGAPERRHPPVGTPGSRTQPPITRWDYPRFSVFFENDRVLNTVVHR